MFLDFGIIEHTKNYIKKNRKKYGYSKERRGTILCP